MYSDWEIYYASGGLKSKRGVLEIKPIILPSTEYRATATLNVAGSGEVKISFSLDGEEMEASCEPLNGKINIEMDGAGELNIKCGNKSWSVKRKCRKLGIKVIGGEEQEIDLENFTITYRNPVKTFLNTYINAIMLMFISSLLQSLH